MSSALLDKLFAIQVFTLDEAFKLAEPGQTRDRVRAVLNQYARRGRIGRVRSGLYYSIPRGRTSATWVPDRFLVASKLDAHAVLAYHSALELLGGGYSAWNEIYVLASRRHWRGREAFTFRDVAYRMVQPPRRLGARAFTFGIETLERFGQPIRLTGRSRTLVDCLDRLDYTGGLDELLNSMVTWPSVDIDAVESYLQILGRRVLYARVGFVFEGFARQWAVPETFLEAVRGRIPKRTTYLGATVGRARFVRRWRLMVPVEITERVPVG